MKGKKGRAGGGVVEPEESAKDVYAGRDSEVIKSAEERKRGGRVERKRGGKVEGKEVGRVEGKMSKMRMDRPGRKMGGRVGAEKSPMSGASRTDGPDGGPSQMECD